jgi:hypothetical protein
MKPKAKFLIRSATIKMFYIPQKENTTETAGLYILNIYHQKNSTYCGYSDRQLQLLLDVVPY